MQLIQKIFWKEDNKDKSHILMNHDYFKAKNTFSHTLLEYKVGFDLPTWSWEQVEENTLYYSITDGFYMQVFKYRKRTTDTTTQVMPIQINGTPMQTTMFLQKHGRH